MKKEPQIFTQINRKNVSVGNDIMNDLRQEEIAESLAREYIRTLLEQEAEENFVEDIPVGSCDLDPEDGDTGGEHNFHGNNMYPCGAGKTAMNIGKGGPFIGHGNVTLDDVNNAKKYLDTFKPDKLVAYSRGGAVAQQADPSADVTYLAPAWGRTYGTGVDVKGPGEIFHGGADRFVPLKNICQASQSSGMDVSVAPDRGHGSILGDYKSGNMSRYKKLSDQQIQACVDSLEGWGSAEYPTKSDKRVEDQNSWVKKVTSESALRKVIRTALQEESTKNKVLGYIKPASSFHTLLQWELVVEELLKLQKQGVDTRGGMNLNQRLLQIIDEYFGFQYNVEVERYDLLTQKNILDFIEDFANHRFWGLEREFSSYFPDMSKLKFAYFYSRGDLEPYVLLDEEFTTQIYGSVSNPKMLKHYTTQAGVNRIQAAIDSEQPFDISCFTVAERPFFRPQSNLIVTLEGNVRAGFRSDIKSVAVDTGRRACNMYRLEYPGKDKDNLCRELDTCDGEIRTSLWNEYIATPKRIISIDEAKK